MCLKRLHYDLALKEKLFYFYYVHTRVTRENSLCVKQALVLFNEQHFFIVMHEIGAQPTVSQRHLRFDKQAYIMYYYFTTFIINFSTF